MSLSTGDLTTLATAKAYLTGAPADAILTGLITRISRSVQSALNRSLLVPKAYTQQFDGTGTRQIMLPNWPILSISSIKISGVATPLAAQIDNSNPVGAPFGYRFQPWDGVPPGIAQAVELVGYSFLGGRQNVVVTYSAGYQVTNEAQTIPASTAYTIAPNTPYGIWASDQGVTFTATGVALTAISSGTPAAGQYLPPDPNATPTPRLVYTFAAADASKGVLLTYGFVPADVEQLTLELIAERTDYRRRVGVRSQTLASQETITYDNSSMNSYIRDVLCDYWSPLPPAIGASV